MSVTGSYGDYGTVGRRESSVYVIQYCSFLSRIEWG